MKVSASRVLLPLCLVLSALGVGIFLGEHLSLKNARPASDASFQQEMDAYCTAKLNDGLSNLSPDGEKGILAIYLTPPTPTSSVLGCGRGLSQDVA